MIEVANPIKLIIPGGPVSLKNDRMIIRGATPKEDKLIPSPRVKRIMNNIRAAIQRQLPGDFSILETGVFVILECHIAYGSKFPKSDIDNHYTTIQECLEGTVIENDRQVEGFFVFRKRAKSKMSQFSYLYFWETNYFILEELHTFMEMKKDDIEFGLSNGHGRNDERVRG